MAPAKASGPVLFAALSRRVLLVLSRRVRMRYRYRPCTTIDVLIAEDDSITRMALRQILEGEGYQCAEAEDGPEAVEIAQQCPPRLALLDVMMPGQDGFSVAQQFQSDPRTRGVRIL